MCLAVPGKLTEWIERESPFAEGMVEFAGIRRRTNLACVPEVIVGDFVLVHAGVAISRIEADEAARILETLKEIEDELPSDDSASLMDAAEERP